MTNDLVSPVTQAAPPGGLGGFVQPLGNASAAAQACGDGDWIEGSLFGFKGGLDVLGFISDPLGTLFSWGVGWLIDHVEPFPTWLDQLAGDPDTIMAFARTWDNCAGRVSSNADTLRTTVRADTAHWDGLAVDAYRLTAREVAEGIDEMAGVMRGVGHAVEAAGGLVGGVRETVKETISDIIGTIGASLVKFLTVVLAPDAVRTLSTKVASLAGKIGTFVDDLITSMGKFGTMLDDLWKWLETAGPELMKLYEKWDNAFANRPDLALNSAISLSQLNDDVAPSGA